jgi:hypothetical protein
VAHIDALPGFWFLAATTLVAVMVELAILF